MFIPFELMVLCLRSKIKKICYTNRFMSKMIILVLFIRVKIGEINYKVWYHLCDAIITQPFFKNHVYEEFIEYFLINRGRENYVLKIQRKKMRNT